MSHTPLIDSGIVNAPEGRYGNPSTTAAPSQASQNGITLLTQEESEGVGAPKPLHHSGVKTIYTQAPSGPTPLHQTTIKHNNNPAIHGETPLHQTPGTAQAQAENINPAPFPRHQSK